jgi:predicted small lipoprotein YifL
VKQSVGRSRRLALVAVMTAALGLTGCGRKGPLDPPPPSAEVPPAPANAPRAGLGQENYGPLPPPAEHAVSAAAAPPPTPPPPKTFFLDFLIGK